MSAPLQTVLGVIALMSVAVPTIGTPPLGCMRFRQPAEIDSVRAALDEEQIYFLLSPVRTAIRERPRAEDQWEPVARVVAAFEATDMGRRMVAHVGGGRIDPLAIFGLKPAEASVDEKEPRRIGFLYHVLGAGLALRWYSEGELSTSYCAAYFAIRQSTAACPAYRLASTDLGTTELVLQTLQDAAANGTDVRAIAQVLRVLNAHRIIPPVVSLLDIDSREFPHELTSTEWFQELPHERQRELLRGLDLYFKELEQTLDVPARHRWEAIEFAERLLDPEFKDDLRFTPDPLREADYLPTFFDGVRIMMAIRVFSAAHGQPPASLEDLVPAFLPELPVDSASGQPFIYRVIADDAGWTVQLYAVGADGVDDGGTGCLQCSKEAFNFPRKVGVDFLLPAIYMPRVNTER